MIKYLFFNVLVLFFVSIISLSAQPKGALAPKERAIEDAPEDSVSIREYYGMSYEQLKAVFGSFKNAPKDLPLEELQKKENELLHLRDTAWTLVKFMEAPIKERAAEGLAREAHRAKLVETLKDAQAAQAAFLEERNNRLRMLDSLANPQIVDDIVEEVAVDESETWFGGGTPAPAEMPTTAPSPNIEKGKTKKGEKTKKSEKGKKEDDKISEKEGAKKTKKKNEIKKNDSSKKKDDKKNNEKTPAQLKREQELNKIAKDRAEARKKVDEQKAKQAAQQEKEIQAKEKKAEQLQAKNEKKQEKNEKKQAKFIEREQAALEAAIEDSTKMAEEVQLLEDSLARYIEESKAFEDSTELMRANLKPIKNLSAEIRREWVMMHFAVLGQNDIRGSEAEEDFYALIDEFHNTKIDAILKILDDASFVERIKKLRDDLFLSKKIPNINCNGGIGNFMKGQFLSKEEIENVWEEMGRRIWQTTKKNQQKTREISNEEYRAIGRSADCVGYILGLGDDCNLVMLKLIDDSKIAIICKKNKEDDMSAIKLIK